MHHMRIPTSHFVAQLWAEGCKVFSTCENNHKIMFKNASNQPISLNSMKKLVRC